MGTAVGTGAARPKWPRLFRFVDTQYPAIHQIPLIAYWRVRIMSVKHLRRTVKLLSCVMYLAQVKIRYAASAVSMGNRWLRPAQVISMDGSCWKDFVCALKGGFLKCNETILKGSNSWTFYELSPQGLNNNCLHIYRYTQRIKIRLSLCFLLWLISFSANNARNLPNYCVFNARHYNLQRAWYHLKV